MMAPHCLPVRAHSFICTVPSCSTALSLSLSLFLLLVCADGEDGAVKIWSRTGMLRSVLAQSSELLHCIY